ncbi:MAG: HD domain-containing protein [Candidatus Nanohaloarchaea archaeon]|nr:HD domain-containing protein [Candidatus Nanohaloarchaea archaeon]
MFIQDPIHGYIQLNDLETDIISSEAYQRLRRIKQLGCSHLVYPSTSHTRFEHSLGTAYLAGRFADYLDLDDDDRNHLRTAALLHDTGHGPFSHVSERVMENYGKSHEDFSADVIRGPLSDTLEQHGVDPDRVVDLVNGRTELGSVIAGDIDVDRMDYLMRDSHYSGVAHGTIDDETIMRAATLHNGSLVFHAKFRQALEGLLTARYLMIPTVYTHDSVTRAEKMMERGIDEMVVDGSIDVDELATMDDIDLKYRLRHTDNERARSLNSRLDNRNIFKTALRWDVDDLSRDGMREIARNMDDEREIEEEIADEAGMPVEEVLVNSPHIPAKQDVDVSLLDGDETTSLDEVSRLTQAVHSTEWEQVALEVYCPPRRKEAVSEAAKAVLKQYKSLLQKFF